jgi:2-hydroxychromene-2-carboxylate isomerase
LTDAVLDTRPADTTAEFWFDPICPFTWRTSRWVRDVAPRRDAEVDWRVMSLAILNEGNETPEQYRPMMVWSAGALRLLVAAKQAQGNLAVDNLYTAIGTRMHEKGEGPSRDLLAGALEDAGLPAEMIAAADDESLDTAIGTSHGESQERAGTETGSPVTAIGDAPGFFGPVISPVPEGEAADRLFDAFALLSTVPQFAELKRARNPF